MGIELECRCRMRYALPPPPLLAGALLLGIAPMFDDTQLAIACCGAKVTGDGIDEGRPKDDQR